MKYENLLTAFLLIGLILLVHELDAKETLDVNGKSITQLSN